MINGKGETVFVCPLCDPEEHGASECPKLQDLLMSQHEVMDKLRRYDLGEFSPAALYDERGPLFD